MGEIGIGKAGDTLVTLLGSCIAVVLFDQKQKVAGLAHIQLPAALDIDSAENAKSRVDGDGKYVDTAIHAMLRQVSSSDRSNLVVHLAGGADMFKTSRQLTVGKLNIQAAQRLLGEMNLCVASSDCGGTQARRVRFEVSTGLMLVEQIKKTTKAYK